MPHAQVSGGWNPTGENYQVAWGRFLRLFTHCARNQLHSQLLSPFRATSCLAKPLWQGTEQNQYALQDLCWFHTGPAKVSPHPGVEGEPDSAHTHLSWLSLCCGRVYHHTWSQPGFSSGPGLIPALWLHSSEKQPRAQAQLCSAACTAAGVCASSLATTQYNIYLSVDWFLCAWFWVFVCFCSPPCPHDT